MADTDDPPAPLPGGAVAPPAHRARKAANRRYYFDGCHCGPRPVSLQFAPRARIAQQVEQLICNQQVGGSIPSAGIAPDSSDMALTPYTDRKKIGRFPCGGVPERPKGADCKSAGSTFGGSNPPPSTRRA